MVTMELTSPCLSCVLQTGWFSPCGLDAVLVSVCSAVGVGYCRSASPFNKGVFEPLGVGGPCLVTSGCPSSHGAWPPLHLDLGSSSSLGSPLLWPPCVPSPSWATSRVRLALRHSAVSFAGPRGAVSPQVQVCPELVMEAEAKGSLVSPAWASTKPPVWARCPLEVLVQRKCFLPSWAVDQYLSWRVSGIWGWPDPEGQCGEMVPPC